MIKHCWAQPSAAMCLAVGVDTGLFHYLSCDDAGCPCMKGRGGGGEEGEQGAGKGMEETYPSPSQDHIPAAAATANGATPPAQGKNPNPKSLTVLSTRTGIPPSLLSRLLRHLTAVSHIRQPTPSTFLPTPFSSALTHPCIGDGYPVILASLPALTCFPQYAKLTDYREPDDPAHGPYQFGVRTDRGFFEDVGVEKPLGARAYYLHSVLHDWPKPLASAILTRIAQAMEPGYSKLLIHENCIPALGAHWEATALDMMMLGLVASKERTDHEWRELIEATVRQDGYRLRVVGIWGDGEEEGVESLIECELV
ncbi:hypothetical protein KC345_g7638 [Hortaea werneckii]|nr:hypothetical protein KC345_g7638 [Hortaea werneckii]